MPGATKVVSGEFNDLVWEIPQSKAHTFEKLIGEYLINRIATPSGTVKVFPTQAVNDYGKDFKINAHASFELFGTFIPRNIAKETTRVYLEVKGTTHERLAGGFIEDIAQNFEDEIDYYVLVTNSTLTPYYQFVAQQNWRARNVEFVLIDKFLLAALLNSDHDLKQEFNQRGVSIPSIKKMNDVERVSVEYQIEQREFTESHKIELFLSVRNYLKETRAVSLKLATDQSWYGSLATIDKLISGNGLETYRLEYTRILFDGPADLRIAIDVDGTHETILIQENKLKFVFEPSFIGKAHREIRDKIIDLTRKNMGLAIISITGEAGIGKSRIIEEAEKMMQGGRNHFAKYYFSQKSSVSDFIEFTKQFDTDFNFSALIETKSLEECSRKFLNEFNPNISQWVISFEDLHHASTEVIQVFKDYILSPSKKKNSTILILTGRNDFTFPNESYFSLLQVLGSIENRMDLNFQVTPFQETESEGLIRQLITNAPETAVEKILRLSQNNPFIIIEFVQFLLDSDLAQLLSRKYVGIIDIERFSSDISLPDSIEELYLKRLYSLQLSNQGQLGFKFLVIASFFGFEISDKITNLFLDGKENDRVFISLLERRFLKESSSSSKLTFAHENIIHFLQKFVRLPENRKWCSELLFSNNEIFELLSEFEKGELRCFSCEYSAAMNYFNPIWKRIQSISNFSSEEIDKSYFNFLDPLFECANALKIPKEEVAKIILAKAYMGIHNFPLYIGQQACLEAEQMLKTLYPRKAKRTQLGLSIAQLRAHGLQNMGKTSEALQLMLEIESELRVRNIESPELEFDLNDRLQEYYRKTNHLELSANYAGLALTAVEKCGDEKLKLCHLITMAGLNLLSGKENATDSANEAYLYSKGLGIKRLTTYTYLTTLIVSILYPASDSLSFSSLYSELKDLLLFAAKNNLSDSIMRIQLVLATLCLHLSGDDEYNRMLSHNYINAGQENSIRYGNGLFDWAFDNLAVLIDLQNSSPPESVKRRFETCHERLKRRGLLFLGANDGIFPNYLAISNIIRFFGESSETNGMKYLSTLNAYNNEFLFIDKFKRQLLATAISGEAIFIKTENTVVSLRYPRANGYFTPLF